MVATPIWGPRIALFRQRSPQPKSRGVVAALESVCTLLERPRNRPARQHQSKNDTGQNMLQHGEGCTKPDGTLKPPPRHEQFIPKAHLRL
jgi:hypothetical protein